jgi:hypothetical protein
MARGAISAEPVPILTVVDIRGFGELPTVAGDFSDPCFAGVFPDFVALGFFECDCHFLVGLSRASLPPTRARLQILRSSTSRKLQIPHLFSAAIFGMEQVVAGQPP